MDVRSFLNQNTVILDGGMGTLLQAAGLKAGELPERRNLTHPDDIVSIHRAYYDAGSHIVNTNTFGANTVKYSVEELRQIIPAAVSHARRAAELSNAPQSKLVALDIGPLGRLIEPYGNLAFDDAVEIFATTVRIGVEAGVDLITIETMSDSMETRAALLAVKENCELPVIVSNAYGADGKLMTGSDPACMVAILEGLGADAIGINCSLGPEQMTSVVKKYTDFATLPVLVKPNAGLPRCEGDKTFYDVAPDVFAATVADFVRNGARLVGGCCGTTPEYIAALNASCEGVPVAENTDKNRCVICSYHHSELLDHIPHPVGKSVSAKDNPAVLSALLEDDLDSIVDEAFEDLAEGAKILKIHVASDAINEEETLAAMIKELQAVINLPFWIQTDHAAALDRALRIYNGKAMVSPTKDSLDDQAAYFAAMKKYGAVLALEESTDSLKLAAQAAGIPANHLFDVNDQTIEYV